MTFQRLLTTSEAAELLGVSTSWLKKQIMIGAVPCTRLGRSVRFSEQQLALIASRGEVDIGPRETRSRPSSARTRL